MDPFYWCDWQLDWEAAQELGLDSLDEFYTYISKLRKGENDERINLLS